MAGQRRIWGAVGLAVAVAWTAPALGQILGGRLPGLPAGGLSDRLGELPRLESPRGLRAPAMPMAIQPLSLAADLAGAPLSEVRRLTAAKLLREHADVIEADDQGQPAVRGEVLALGLDHDALARVRDAGFTVHPADDLDGLGIQAVVLAAPRGQSAAEAIRRLKALEPAGQYDFNHLYQAAGAAGSTLPTPNSSTAVADGRGLKIGLVDGSVARSDPTLARAHLVQRGFAAGGMQITRHATAVASLIAGGSGQFHGAAPGATLYVADVYGPKPTGGSAEAIVRALAWLARSNVTVVNVSLVGPPNLLLEHAVRALLERGALVVAAVGNDGPAAPPLYPASYPGVVAVTAVDPRGRVLPEAGRGTHVDFAAPGSDMAAARVPDGYVSIRGSSFAAPIVAGRLAVLRGRGSAAQALEALAREATDLGAPGPDPIYGRGLVGAALRLDPASLRQGH